MRLGNEQASAPSQPVVGPARLLPVLTTLLSALLMLEPVPLPRYAGVTPLFTLMAVYQWTLYQPALVPASALFAIGFLYDLLAGAPLGVTPLLLLLARAAVLRFRRWFADREFSYVWAGFAGLTGVTALGLWGLDCLLAGRLLRIGESVFRAALTVALFPIASFLLGRAQRALIGSG